MRARLRIESGGSSRSLFLEAGRHTLGRGAGADLRVDDGAASREHLVLHVGEAVSVEDLGSRNGTYLGGRRLRGTAPWRPGEALEVGATRLILELDESMDRPGRRMRFGRLPWDRWGARLRGRRIRLACLTGILLLCLSALSALLPAAEGKGGRELRRLRAEELQGASFGWDRAVDHQAKRFEIAWRPSRPLEDSLVWLQVEVEPPEAGLSLALNGVEIAAWAPDEAADQRLLLPAALLVQGENLIAFSPAGEGAWSVWELAVEEAPRPRCGREACVEEAARLITRGRESVGREAIDAGKRFAAWLAFRGARRLLEGLDPKPALYATAVGLEEEAGAALDAACRRFHFGVVQRLAFGRDEEALRIARRMLRSFPGEEHPCHARALDTIERLSAAGGR